MNSKQVSKAHQELMSLLFLSLGRLWPFLRMYAKLKSELASDGPVEISIKETHLA